MIYESQKSRYFCARKQKHVATQVFYPITIEPMVGKSLLMAIKLRVREMPQVTDGMEFIRFKI